MKKLVFAIVCLSFMVFSVQAQNGKATVTHMGKLIFVNSVPTNPYKVVGKTKFNDSKSNLAAAGADPSGIKKVAIAIEDIMKKVQKGKQADFDAVIAYSPLKIELIKFTNGGIAENSACTVGVKDYIKKKCGQKDMFFLSEPTKPYTVVADVEVKNFTNIGQLKMGKDDIDNFLNKLYERGCKEAKEGVEFDAIIFVDANIVVSGLISAQNIKLIKYN